MKGQTALNIISVLCVILAVVIMARAMLIAGPADPQVYRDDIVIVGVYSPEETGSKQWIIDYMINNQVRSFYAKDEEGLDQIIQHWERTAVVSWLRGAK